MVLRTLAIAFVLAAASTAHAEDWSEYIDHSPQKPMAVSSAKPEKQAKPTKQAKAAPAKKAAAAPKKQAQAKARPQPKTRRK